MLIEKTHNNQSELNEQNIKKFINNFSKSIINDEASVFIGAGTSIESGLPSWYTLLKPCVEELGLTEENDISLYKIAQYYANTNSKSTLKRLVNDNLNILTESNPLLNTLLKVKFRSIWTTNFDNLIEKELEHNKINFNKITNEKDLAQTSTYDKINIYKINGDVSSPNSMVITQSEYEQYDKTHSLFLTFLKKELVSNTFLFVGYSFEDQIILNCLSDTMKLLSDSGTLHYAFIYFDKMITKKMQYHANDLKKRYNIECIFVNSKSAINILKKLDKKTKENKVFISGSYHHVDDKTDHFADALSKALVAGLLANNNIICTSIGKRFGTYIVSYANQYLIDQSCIVPHKRLEIKPFPFHTKLTDKKRKAYREYIQEGCNFAIFLFGQSNDCYYGNNESITRYSKGVYEEFLLAKKLKLYIIPIGSTGYEASLIWQEVKKDIDKYSYLKDYIDDLNQEKNPKKIVEIILSIIKKQIMQQNL